jgi:hypothetical protein
MTKICMIGNSHVAAMRLAWDKVAADYPTVDAHIYGAHARNLVSVQADAQKELRFDGPPLWSFRAGDEPGRARSIPLGGCDAIVIVGCDFGPTCVFRTYKRYHFAGLKGRRKQALTRDYFKRGVAAAVDESAAGVLAKTIRAVVGVPVLLVPAPLPAESGFADFDKTKMEPYRAAQEAGDGQNLMEIYDELCGDLDAGGLHVIRQPEITKASPLSSLQRYSDNSTRLRADDDALHPENDYFHMNEEYGSLVWAEIIGDLRIRHVIAA